MGGVFLLLIFTNFNGDQVHRASHTVLLGVSPPLYYILSFQIIGMAYVPQNR